MDLASLMRQPVLTVTPATSLRQARALMTRHGIRHLPVLEAGVPVGLITDRLLRRAEPSSLPTLAAYEQTAWLEQRSVTQAMTRRLLQRPPHTPVHEAAWLLWQGQSESILIVEHGTLLGIVTRSDLLGALSTVAERRWRSRYGAILLPVDIHDVPETALETARALAAQHQAQLTLLYVLPALGSALAGEADQVSTAMLLYIDDDRRATAWQQLTALLERTDELRLRYQVAEGSLVRHIIATAMQIQADLIIMGWRTRHGLRRFWPRSSIAEVTREAPCPVLTVKEHGRRPHARR
ncbi:MAG: universal stress protein [Candidatus Tectimicrobiota bacterium]